MHNFKLIIYGDNIYRESILDNNSQFIKIGTTKESDIRFNEKIFLKSFEISFFNTDDTWEAVCDENTQIDFNGDIFKSKKLKHGDNITIKYFGTDVNIISIDFLVDFENTQDFNRIIDIQNKNKIVIGGTIDCDIFIDDNFAKDEIITLARKDGQYILIDNDTTYGVYINGRKINSKARIRNYDFFMFVGYSFYLKDDKIYTTSDSGISVLTLDDICVNEDNSVLKYPNYNISTRKKYIIPDEEIDILPPKAKPREPKKNMLLLIYPPVAMIILIILIRGVMGGGGYFVIYSVCSMVITLSVSIIGYFYSKKDYET